MLSNDMLRFGLRRLSPLVLAAACASEPTSETPLDPGGTTEPDPPVACTPQAWPIEDEGHQLDRVAATVEGIPTFYWVPPAPRAVVAMFPGSHQSVDAMGSVEHEEWYNELAKRDIAYFSLAARDGDYDLSRGPNNVDFRRLDGLRTWLVENTPLDAALPVAFAGFSGGSGFAVVAPDLALDAGWEVLGSSVHGGGASASPASVPTVFTAHENDPSADPEGVRDAYQTTVDAGVPALLFDLQELVLEPDRFTKIPNIDAYESQIWFDELVEGEIVDADGVRLVPVDDIPAALSAFVAASSLPGPGRARAQLSVIWRMHIWSADRSCDEADFLLDQLR